MKRAVAIRAAFGVLAIVIVAAFVTLPALAGVTAGPRLIADVSVGRETLTDDLTHACPQGSVPTLQCAERDTEAEPSIAVNPTDPNNIVTTFQVGRFYSGGGAADNGYATSFDGGSTWKIGYFQGISAAGGGLFDRMTDPVVAFGPGGVVYAVGDAVEMDVGKPGGLASFTSRDGGKTWEKPVLIVSDSVHGTDPREPTPYFTQDKAWIAVDMAGGQGHHLGRVYASWMRFYCSSCPVLMAYSDDRGQTWQSGPAGTGYVVEPASDGLSVPMVLPDGGLAIFSTDNLQAQLTAEDRLHVVIAPTAGSTPTGSPIVFTGVYPVGIQGYVQGFGCISSWYAVAADASGGPNDGRVYAAWVDNTRRIASDEWNDLVLTHSDDGGKTWSIPSVVNPTAAPGTNIQCPMLAVAADGTVKVAYITHQERLPSDVLLMTATSIAPQFWTKYQESADGGSTFTPPLTVEKTPNDIGFAADHTGEPWIGDYTQMVVSRERAFIARPEPYGVSSSETSHPEEPTFHHMRIWVAAIGSPRKSTVLAKNRIRGVLAKTGVTGRPMGFALIAMALLIAAVAKRNDPMVASDRWRL